MAGGGRCAPFSSHLSPVFQSGAHLCRRVSQCFSLCLHDSISVSVSVFGAVSVSGCLFSVSLSVCMSLCISVSLLFSVWFSPTLAPSSLSVLPSIPPDCLSLPPPIAPLSALFRHLLSPVAVVLMFAKEGPATTWAGSFSSCGISKPSPAQPPLLCLRLPPGPVENGRPINTEASSRVGEIHPTSLNPMGRTGVPTSQNPTLETC